MNSKNIDPFSQLNRLKLWALRYLRRRDILLFALTAFSYFFLLATFRSHPRIAIPAAFVYTFLIFLIGFDLIVGRRNSEYARSAVLREFFEQLGNEVFCDVKKYRITIFRQSPFNAEYIVPWYRYTKGDNDIITPALKSHAKYRKGEGHTGDAWENHGQELILASFPDFQGSREEFAKYYKLLKIDSDTISELSDMMVSVRTIISYGFEGESGNFLGVLSIDLEEPLSIDEETGSPVIGETFLYADTLLHTLRSINIVLQGFANAETRTK